MTMEEKRFIKPEAEVVEFTNEDIITGSSPWGIGDAGEDEVP